MRRVSLVLLFVVLPAVELALLIEIGSRIGAVTTVTLIAMTFELDREGAP